VKQSHLFYPQKDKNPYKYKIDQNSGTVSLQQCPDNPSPNPTTIVAPFIFCLPQGVVPFDPFMMYPRESTKLWIQYNWDLSTLFPALELELPYVKNATSFRFQGSTIIYFVPYNVGLKKQYFEQIIVYRWSPHNSRYEYCFQYSRPGFHITCASSSSEYLALSRLPYSESELMMEERSQDIISELVRQNAELRRREEQRQEQRRLEQMRRDRELQDQWAKEKRRAELDRILRDPIDFFVWSEESKKFKLVVEYHKPADQVQILGKDLWIVKDGGTHQFEIQVRPKNLVDFEGFPIFPDSMCPAF